MRTQALVAPLLALLSLSATAAAPDLTWLQGNWCGTGQNGTQEEELWLAPRGGLMLGLHRDTRGERAISFEFLRIELRDDKAVYVAQPGGRPPVRFETQQVGPRSITFANLEHAFPKRVRYERPDAQTLLARIDDGSDTGKSFSWRWTACPSPRQQD